MREELLKISLDRLSEIESGEIIRIYELVQDQRRNYPEFFEDTENLMWLWKNVLDQCKSIGVFLYDPYNVEEETGVPYLKSYAVAHKNEVGDNPKNECIELHLEILGGLLAKKHSELHLYKEDLPAEFWGQLMETVFDECHIADWQDTEFDYSVTDVEEWCIKLAFENSKIKNLATWRGSSWRTDLNILGRAFKSVMPKVFAK